MGKLNENIVVLRKQNNMSQSDLANILFVTPQAVSRWERGETEPDIETIKKLAEVFHSTVEEVINGPKSIQSKRLEKIIRLSYIIGSILMVVLSIIFIILSAFDVNFYVVLFVFVGIAFIFFTHLLTCEILQQKFKKDFEKAKEEEK